METRKPGYGLGDGPVKVVLETGDLTGTAEISLLVSGREYDAENMGFYGDDLPDGTILIKKTEVHRAVSQPIAGLSGLPVPLPDHIPDAPGHQLLGGPIGVDGMEARRWRPSLPALPSCLRRRAWTARSAPLSAS